MSLEIKLSEIVEEIGFQMDESSLYLDRNTGSIIRLSEAEIRAAEDGDALDDDSQWQYDNLEDAQRVVNEDKDLLSLPDQFEIDEYRIMENFCRSVQDNKTCEALCMALKGSGAFRRFKDCVHSFEIADDWYSYRKEALKEIAIRWCEGNELEYIDDPKDKS